MANRTKRKDHSTASPELNIIEKVGVFVAKKVKKRRKQCRKVTELKEAIEDAWDEMDSDYIFKL